MKDRACHEGWDEEFGCWIVDEDKVCRALLHVGIQESLDLGFDEVRGGLVADFVRVTSCWIR